MKSDKLEIGRILQLKFEIKKSQIGRDFESDGRGFPSVGFKISGFRDLNSDIVQFQDSL